MAVRLHILIAFLLVGTLTAHGQDLRTAARGELQAVCADPDGAQWAVTDAGEILRSADGTAWTVFDFNARYAGYYPKMS